MPAGLKLNRPALFGPNCVFFANLQDLSTIGDEGWTTPDNAPTIVETAHGKAMQFVKANTESILIGPDPTITRLGNCTVSMLVSVSIFDASGQSGRIFSVASGAADRFGLCTVDVAGDHRLFIYDDINNANIEVEIAAGLTVNTWYLATWTMGVGGVVTYLNTTPGGTNASVLTFSDIAGAVNVMMGRPSWGVTAFADSIIKYLWVFNSRLSLADITTLYNDIIGLGTNP